MPIFRLKMSLDERLSSEVYTKKYFSIYNIKSNLFYPIR